MATVTVSRSGIVTLYKRFLSLATHRDKATNEHFLTEADFQNIAELQQNPLGQRIIDAFFADAEYVPFICLMIISQFRATVCKHLMNEIV
ncbi:hypothetical protein NECAME_14550 [Necator americanus]|uniref:Uncharacterized protein n=1 Tax=Necator americanus TaxID=51031 RepID=W2SML1_NECAM|nr:hypothetical protein NECAME_14550 [Necator americanus]ETN70748.1 hypothetical protein NECAME_14550 [Necator americanus]